jgi:hypothetical protein
VTSGALVLAVLDAIGTVFWYSMLQVYDGHELSSPINGTSSLTTPATPGSSMRRNHSMPALSF